MQKYLTIYEEVVSHMTLRLLHTEFPYIQYEEKFDFSFLSVYLCSAPVLQPRLPPPDPQEAEDVPGLLPSLQLSRPGCAGGPCRRRAGPGMGPCRGSEQHGPCQRARWRNSGGVSGVADCLSLGWCKKEVLLSLSVYNRLFAAKRIVS
jgi:hypothetical protein